MYRKKRNGEKKGKDVDDGVMFTFQVSPEEEKEKDNDKMAA